MKKNSLRPLFFLNLVGFVIGAAGQALRFLFPQDSEFLPYLQYFVWVVSTGLIIVPWIWRANSILKRLTETAGIAEELPGKLNELTIWRRNEHLDKIRITVSDFDDYLILLPLHLSVSFLKGMDVEFETHCCGSDKKALEELDGTDLVYVGGRTNLNDEIRLNPENKMYYCAPWTKFIRREFLGETRFPEDQAQPDWFYNNDLQAKEHTEKYTDLIVYQYNFPREGSITWKAMHSSSTT